MADEATPEEVQYNDPSADEGREVGEGRIGATDAFKTAIATYIGQQGRLISLHSADPGTTGANEIAGSGYARKETTWGAAAIVNQRGQITGSVCTFDVPGGVAINYYGVRAGTVAAPGAFLYGKPLQPGATLNAAGKITLTPTHAYGLL